MAKVTKIEPVKSYCHMCHHVSSVLDKSICKRLNFPCQCGWSSKKRLTWNKMWPSVWIIDNLMSISHSVHFQTKWKFSFWSAITKHATHMLSKTSAAEFVTNFLSGVTKNGGQTGHRLTTELFNDYQHKNKKNRRNAGTQTHHVTLRDCLSVLSSKQHAQTHTDILCHSSSCESVHKRPSQSSGGVCL